MGLRYDFDVHTVATKERFCPASDQEAKPDFGVSVKITGVKVALFRDPATAAALRDAPISIRSLFIDAGFGLNSQNSGVPDGFYPENDAATRRHILDRLQRHLGDGVPVDHDKGTFNLVAFFDSVSAAHPISDAALSSYHRALRHKAESMLDFDRTLFFTKVTGVVILAFITSRLTIGL